jgi:APA family basic amino acid/polyamine antiporter
MRREIGLALAALIVVNSTIGTGIFKTPAQVARLTDSMSIALTVWVVGGVIALCGALSMAELSASMPRTGGLYEILRRAYGPKLAFLFGWAKLTLLIPSAVGSFARLAAEALVALLALEPNAPRDTGLAITFLVIAAGFNLLGVKTNTLQQALITVAKYVGVALLAAVGLLWPLSEHAPAVLQAGTKIGPGGWAGAFAAMVSVMWAYDGWADLASLSGEVKNPGKTLPKALILGTASIVAVYMAANLGYARTLGLVGLQASTTGSNMAGANLVRTALGAVGQSFLSLLVLISCLGGTMGSLLTGSRIFVPMASDGVFVAWLGKVSPTSHIPARAVAVSALCGLGYVVNRSFEQLTDGFVVGYFPFYILAVASLAVLRYKEPDLERPFKVPGYPLVPLLFILGAVALLWGALSSVDKTAGLSLLVMLAGFPVQWVWATFFRGPVPEATTQPDIGISPSDET